MADRLHLDGYTRVRFGVHHHFYGKGGIRTDRVYCFFASAFVLLLNIRSTYLREFANEQFVPVIQNRKPFLWVNVLISLLAGLFGSVLVQGLGWEPLLTYLNQASFGGTINFIANPIEASMVTV